MPSMRRSSRRDGLAEAAATGPKTGGCAVARAGIIFRGQSGAWRALLAPRSKGVAARSLTIAPPSFVGRRPSAFVQALLPLLGDRGHRLVDGRLPRPYAVERLGEKVAAAVDGEIRSGDDGNFPLGGESHAVDERAAQVPWRPCGLVVRFGENALPWGRAASCGGPQEAIVGEPLHGLHGRVVTAFVRLRVEFEAADFAIGPQRVADLGEQRRAEVEFLADVAVERPRTRPEDAALPGAEGLIAVGDVARGDLVFVEQVENPLHRCLAGVGIDAGLLQIVARPPEAHLRGHNAPRDGRLNRGTRHQDAGPRDLA